MRFLIALAATCALLASTTPADAEPDPRTGTVLVFGDSTTSRYTDTPGDPQQGWWSMLAAHRKLRPVTSAEAGSGLLKKGRACAGTAVRDRSTAEIRRGDPDEIWIAVGRKDTEVCVNGRAVPIKPQFRKQATAAYFARLAEVADANGISRRNIYVTTIWGPGGTRDRAGVVSAFRDAAESVGVRYITTPQLSAHPVAARKTNKFVMHFFGSKMSPHFDRN